MIRFSDEMELRHAFNVTGCGRTLPEDEVHGFRSAVDELTRDFKQLATMLLTVIILDLFNNYVSFLFMNLINLLDLLLFYFFLRTFLLYHYHFIYSFVVGIFCEEPCCVFDF